MIDIERAIPHRPPFLYVDEVLELTDDRIVAVKTIDPAEPFFQGHYPHFPIMPGVLVLESIFQAGAILLSQRMGEGEGGGVAAGVPVLTRIQGAKFKGMVRPGDRIELTATLKEQLQNAFFLTGQARVDGRRVVSVDFACALARVE